MQRPQVPVMSFCILPQSACMLRVAYQAMYCLEIRICGGGLVSVRDGAHSRFKKAGSMDEFTPTQGLKGFLLNYVDESAVHCRRTQWEDDNPQSPVVVVDETPNRAQSPRDPQARFTHTPPTTNQTNSQPVGSPHILQQSSPNNVASPQTIINSQQLASIGDHVSNNVQSPANAANWTGSPGTARPSPRPDDKTGANDAGQQQPAEQTSPARSWAASVPTLLTNEALETLCYPGPHPQPEVIGPELSPLERFLGCVYMRRNLQRFIQSEEHVR